MKRIVSGVLFLALVANISTAAEPKAIVQKAIDAHGGKAMIEKYPGAKVSFTGEMNIMGNNATITGVNTSDKGKIKVELDIAVAGQKIKIVQIANGDKSTVRISVGGMNIDAPVTEAQREELKFSSNYSDITTLVPLLDEKRFELKAESDEDVDGKKADVISVKFKDNDRSMKLFFDKTSHLLVKTEREGLVPGTQEEKKGKLVTLLADYKKQDGLMIPTKIVSKVDNEVFMTATVTEHVNLEKVDAKEFAVDD